MYAIQRMSSWEMVKRLWPPYRRRREAESRDALRWLIDNPDEPCKVGNEIVHDGYGGYARTYQTDDWLNMR